MSAVYWLNAISDSFSNPSDWSGGMVPGASDDAILNAAGSTFTVTSSVSETVNGVQLASNATLDLAAGVFTATAGTAGGVNAGTIEITNSAQFVVGGMLDNSGGIEFDGFRATMFLAADTTLAGGGDLQFTYGVGEILGADGVALTNVDNTIAGYGIIGYSPDFHLINKATGVIEAGRSPGQYPLEIGSYKFPGGQVTNHGLIQTEAGDNTGSDELVIFNETISGKGGKIIVGFFSRVYIRNAFISQQEIAVGEYGGFDTYSSQISVSGTLNNLGTIHLSGSTLTAKGNVSLSGGGTIKLSASEVSGNSAGVTLNNVDNTIIMYNGDLGGGQLTLVNGGGGTVQGYGTIDVGGGSIKNAGLIVSYGSLTIHGAIDNTGTLAAGIGSTMIATGEITGSGEVVINSGFFGAGTLDITSVFTRDVTFFSQGHTHNGYNPVAVLELAQSQDYDGAIKGLKENGLTALDLDDIGFVAPGEATFSGNSSRGVLTVTDGTHTTHIGLMGDYLGAAFVASSDGHGGTKVVAKKVNGAVAPPYTFISAMAGFGASAASHMEAAESWVAHGLLLTSPRVQVA